MSEQWMIWVYIKPLKKNICLYDGWIMLNNNLRIVQKFHFLDYFSRNRCLTPVFGGLLYQKKMRCWVFYGFPDSLVAKILIWRFKQYWVDRMHNMCYHCPAWNGHKLGVNPLYVFWDTVVTFQPNVLIRCSTPVIIFKSAFPKLNDVNPPGRGRAVDLVAFAAQVARPRWEEHGWMGYEWNIMRI